MLRLIRKNQIITTIFVIFCLMVFVVPQIMQQIQYEQFPSSGDIVHRKFVYLFTNFPNYRNQNIMWEASRSKFSHIQISLFNIVTGLTGSKTFYGYGIANLLAFIITGILVFSFGQRFGIKYALFGVLLFLNTPLLVAPFFGGSDMQFIYIYMSMIFLMVIFMKPTVGARLALFLLLIGAINAHFMPWLPLFLSALVLEYRYPQFKILLWLPLAFIISWSFLEGALLYLTGFSPKLLFYGIVLGFIGIIIFYIIKKKNYKFSHYLLILFGIIALIIFITPQAGDPVYLTLDINNINSAARTFTSASFWNFIFSINPAKNLYGVMIHSILFFISIAGILYVWWKEKSNITEPEDKRITSMVLMTLIPLGILILQFLLLKFNYLYFVKSPIGALHTGRVNLISFFLVAFLIIYFAERTSIQWIKNNFTVLILILLFNAVNISQFYFLRIYHGFSQDKYQVSLQKALESGNNLSGTEAEYSCRFYKKCDLFKSPTKGD